MLAKRSATTALNHHFMQDTTLAPATRRRDGSTRAPSEPPPGPEDERSSASRWTGRVHFASATDIGGPVVHQLQIGARISSNVGHVDLGDRPAADTWEGVAFEALPPVPRVPPAAPATALLFKPALGGVGEGGNTLDAALVGQRVRRTTPASGWRGLLAGFGERDERGGAETEFAASSADDEPLDPAAGAGRLHEQVQPVAVSVPSWRGGTDEGGRERLVGMPASALGSAGCDGDLDYDLRTPVEHQ